MSHIQTPNWFKNNDYSRYEKLNSKELAVELELRRLQIDFLNKPFTDNEINYLFSNVKTYFKGKSKDEIYKVLMPKLLNVTRHDFRFNSYEYNKSIDDIEYRLIKDVISKRSNIIKMLNDIKAVAKTSVAEISYFYTINALTHRVLAFYKFIHEDPFQEGHNYELLKQIEDKVHEDTLIDGYIWENNKIETNNSDDDRIYFKDGLKLDTSWPIESEPLISFFDNFYDNDKDLDGEMDKIRTILKYSEHSNDLPPKPLSQLFLTVDVNSPDEQIINSLMELVNSKRLEQNLKLRNDILQIKINNKKSGGKRIIKTLIEQRIFQYLDLLIWNLEKKQKVTSDWYIQSLFSNEIRNGIIIPRTKMNDTIKPAVKKILNQNWLEAFFKLNLDSYNKLF